MINNQNSLIEERKAVAYKFPDEEGIITLNGIEIKYTFKNDYFGTGNCPHLEFRSVIENLPNPITETGYRSHFFYQDELKNFNSIKEYINFLVEDLKKIQEKYGSNERNKIDKNQGTLF